MASLFGSRGSLIGLVVLVVLVVLLGVTAGCRGEKNRVVVSETVAKPCASNRDCEDGWACLSARCYDTRKSAVFTHPEQMVTPERVRDEVLHQQDQHLRRIEKDLEGTDLSGATR